MLVGILEQGLIYAPMALGLYISFKVLKIIDLTIDGSFTLGAAITTVLILNGVNPILCLLISGIIGGLAGLITGIIHIKFNVRDLLAGIIMMMALYSINLRIVGSSNKPLIGNATIFSNSFVADNKIILIFLIVLALKIILDIYLKTKSGYLLKATGENENLVTTLGKNSGNLTILGLAISNALVALSGSILCQQQNFFDISMGAGAMIAAFATVVIGIELFKGIKFIKPTTFTILGSIVYRAAVAFALYIGFRATDLRLLTAIIFLIVLVLSEKGRYLKK